MCVFLPPFLPPSSVFLCQSHRVLLEDLGRPRDSKAWGWEKRRSGFFLGGVRATEALELGALPPPPGSASGPDTLGGPLPCPSWRGWPRKQSLWFPSVHLLSRPCSCCGQNPQGPPEGCAHGTPTRVKLLPLLASLSAGPGGVRERPGAQPGSPRAESLQGGRGRGEGAVGAEPAGVGPREQRSVKAGLLQAGLLATLRG